MRYQAVALDAMGVVYKVADDLRDLLIPFLRANGCVTADDRLIDAYRDCYRRGAPASTIWSSAGFDDRTALRLEREFLALYKLSEGVVEFLEATAVEGVPVFVLSNDVARWAIQRRRVLGIDRYFEGGIVSGDVGMYKPDAAIFEQFCELLPCHPVDCLFVDDREENLDAASKAGLSTVLFGIEAHETYAAIATFRALREFMS